MNNSRIQYSRNDVKEYLISNSEVSAWELKNICNLPKSTAHSIIQRYVGLKALVRVGGKKLNHLRREIILYKVVDIKIILRTWLDIAFEFLNEIRVKVNKCVNSFIFDANGSDDPVQGNIFNIFKKVLSKQGVPRGISNQNFYKNMNIGKSIEEQLAEMDKKVEIANQEKAKKEKFKLLDTLCRNGNSKNNKNFDEMFNELFNLKLCG